MSKLQRKLFEAFSNFSISEDEKPKKPTKTAEKPSSKPVDDIFKQKPDQPIVPGGSDKKKDGDKPEAPQSPPKRIGGPIRSLTPNADVASMLSRMRDIESGDEVDDEPPPRNVVARRVTPENLPAVISGNMIDAGFQNPEWYTVATLPGNYGRGIRQLGKMLFRSFTRTPTDEIVVIANVLGQGPNSSLEINSVSSWLRNNGREITGGDIDFNDIIPGYRADIKQYTTGDARFLLVSDDHGQYVYTWPEQDSVEIRNTPSLGR